MVVHCTSCAVRRLLLRKGHYLLFFTGTFSWDLKKRKNGPEKTAELLIKKIKTNQEGPKKGSQSRHWQQNEMPRSFGFHVSRKVKDKSRGMVPRLALRLAPTPPSFAWRGSRSRDDRENAQAESLCHEIKGKSAQPRAAVPHSGVRVGVPRLRARGARSPLRMTVFCEIGPAGS